MITDERKRELIDTPVMLNGSPARISGYKNNFPTVRNTRTGEGYEWSWETVDRIVRERDGAFSS